jgi:demethylmenaquinone methyltransferase/2-methoxy-6-polyprenyl-1,4-benzoquinol methylase
MFDRIAPRYDRLNRLLTGGLDQRWRREALERVGVGPGDRVIDVACGTGDLAELAARRGARVTGVDFARGMLSGAARRGVPASLVLGDGTRLPVASGVADVVTCGFALRNFEALEPAFAEMARVLGPGGRLAILEVDRPERAWLRRGHGLYFDRVVPFLGGLLSDRQAYAYLPQSTVYLPPHAELVARLEAAGFADVRRVRRGLGAAQILTARRRGAGV